MSIISESENIATMTVNHYERILRECAEAREENAKLLSLVTRLLMSLQPCVGCDGRGTVGEIEIGSYGRTIRITCSHCLGTGKEGAK